MVGVWLIVLASSSKLYGKVPRLILKKTSRLTQAVVFFRRYFLCGALLCDCSSAEREGLSTYVQRECSAESFMRSILSLRIFTSLPDSRLRFFIAKQIQYSYQHILYLYSSINRLYAQNPVIAIVHDESGKVYLLHMYDGNIQQNPLCEESCATKEFSISPRLSRTIFDPDANAVLLPAHLCTATDSKPYVRNCSREREGLYSGNAQQNSSCAASCVTPSLPCSRLRFFYRRANRAPCSTQFLIHFSPN